MGYYATKSGLKATSFPGPFPWFGSGAGWEKALGSAAHMISEHPNILGVQNYISYFIRSF